MSEPTSELKAEVFTQLISVFVCPDCGKWNELPLDDWREVHCQQCGQWFLVKEQP